MNKCSRCGCLGEMRKTQEEKQFFYATELNRARAVIHELKKFIKEIGIPLSDDIKNAIAKYDEVYR